MYNIIHREKHSQQENRDVASATPFYSTKMRTGNG
ncbi:hypothetical protein PSPHG_CDS_0200 [Pseudomonas phage Psxphi15]